MFLYTLCHVGSERLLKDEVARVAPWLRFAYSRPGFITFKQAEGETLVEPEALIFARTWGRSAGQIRDVTPEVRVAAAQAALVALGWQDAPVRLLVCGRDRVAPGEAYDEDMSPFELAEEARGLLTAAMPTAWLPGEVARQGERVLEVIVLEQDHWWFGAREHRAGRWAHAGGRPRLTAPADAPSRVWEKVEQGLLWSGLSLKPGDSVLDIGCAPGGGPAVLLARGLQVIGVDPADMAPHILSSPGFAHMPTAFELLDPAKLPPKIRLVIFDVNLAPIKTMKPLVRLVSGMKGVDAVLLTLKLNDARMIEKIPWMLTQVGAMGFNDVRATQLAANRQEMCVFGRARRA
jgi:23S rRNA (cytidine2498-2'-O)-methyltransferase